MSQTALAPDRDKRDGKNDDRPSPAVSARRRSPRILLILAGIVIAAGGLTFYVSRQGQESTDDAFTDGRAIPIAPKVAGYVGSLAVTDNQRVRAGQVLLEIDPRDFQVAHDKAASTLNLAEAQLESARLAAEMARITYPSDLASAEAQRASAMATLTKAQADLARQKRVDIRATTQQDIDAATASERSAQASLADAEAKLRKARMVGLNIATADAQVKQIESQVEQARADLAQADLNLAYTHVTAPEDGWVTKRNVEAGAYVQVGQSLMSLVSPDVWVTANFKESQLAGMRPGQTVHIAADAFPQLHLEGRVDSVQMGSGSRFSSFPAENATGNFIKIVQRVPVKVTITGGLDNKTPLPLGLSVVATVNER
ncbi:HlyD family secretion protein [Telmatospirillum siberiense]|uniref:Multidrug export protein EmrA n=1 Tax=Telmatospirillum siberiense TaxID=382514 RepID=A0A2N3PMX2_9PROT|nr:HlyD family secretion protein [Telmatospirillum siberiense]PKU21741.1 multidrug export protein EmrA [Telmatospirillum siberiense]